MEIQPKIRVAVLGPEGSNGHFASKALIEANLAEADVERVFVDSHEEILTGLVAGGKFDYGVLPIENSSRGQGPIREVMDFWIGPDQGLTIVAEQRVVIRHCLIGFPGQDNPSLVMSHPEALSQCRNSLAEMGLGCSQRTYTSSTAMAAKRVSEGLTQLGATAVASRFAAKVYGLEIIKPDINDQADNETRFHLVTHSGDGCQYVDTKANKKVFVFKTAHKVGCLANVLNLFASLDVNVSCLHSLNGGASEGYTFYTEVLRSEEHRYWQKSLMEALRDMTKMARCIGTFPEQADTVST